MHDSILKTRLTIPLAMIMLGTMLVLIGVVGVRTIDGPLMVLPVLIGIFGILWINNAAGMLLLLGRLAIRVAHDGVEVPSDQRSRRPSMMFITRDEIEEIVPHVSLTGRGVDIVRRIEKPIFIDVRYYCSVGRLLHILRDHDYPIKTK